MEVNKTYNENCLETMAKMPENFIDLTITSPPYDNLRKYNEYEFDWKKTIQELYRVTKRGRVVVWIVGDATINGSETGTSFKQALWAIDCGFNLHDTMLYAKNNYIPLTHSRYEQQFEYMFIFSKNKPIVFNPIKIPTLTAGASLNRKNGKAKERTYGIRKRDEFTVVQEQKIKPNIWFYSVGRNDKTKHNAPFPEQLVSDHIISWSNENDLVYDPFMGSGTTAKMSLINNRKFIGSEISAEYCEIAKNRIKEINRPL